MTISTPSLNALLLVYASALCGTLGCVSNEKDAATAGTGGSSSSTGGSSTGGSGGGTGGTSANGAFACPAPSAVVTDFTFVEGGKTDTVSFGDYTTTFSGGTYVYPSMGSYPLTSDVTESNWHVTGTVGDYSGLGLFLSGVNPATGQPGTCTKFDASAFKGIQFLISGSIPMGNTVALTVGTAGDSVASAWLNSHKAAATDPDKDPNFGRCMPVGASEYDGTCNAPSKSVPVTATPTVVKVLWAELTGGKPEATVNPTEITVISWVLPPPAGAGTTAPTTYVADLTIDDLQFIP
jgi:hypothetical protein